MEKIKLSQKEKNARLHNAALTNDLAGIANALKEGAQVNSIVEQMSALMRASREGFPFEVSLLLENGADPNLKSPGRGDTALIFAVDGGYSECTRILLQNKAHVNLMNNNLNSALSLAIYHRYFELAELLMKYGADVNGRAGIDETPLMTIAGLYGDHHSFLGFLIKNGAKLNLRNKFGLTALMYAAESGNKQIISKLLESGAEITPRDSSGKTAIAWAAESDKMDCISLLYRSGANARELLDSNSPASLTEKQKEFIRKILQEENQRRSIARAESLEEILRDLE